MFSKQILSLAATTLLALTGCATPPQPLPFDLVGKGNNVHRGLFKPADGSIEVRIGHKVYSGFYLTSISTAHSTTIGVGYGSYGRYGYGGYGAFPAETWTTVSNNSGKAYLQSADGDKLNCDFIYEGRRLLGECRSLDNDGVTYQMVANPVVGASQPMASSPPAAGSR